VDLIITRGTPAARAAKEATSTIPIVMAAVGEALGVIDSLARPGGNVTGLSAFTTELAGKRVEFAKELLPGAVRLGFFHNMSNPVAPPQWEETRIAARRVSIEAVLLDVRNGEEIAAAVNIAVSKGIDALLVGNDSVTQENRSLIADLTAHKHLPTIYGSKEFVEAGGLISYAVDYRRLYFRAARFVDRILKGAKAGDLPVEQPTRFELVINLKAAKAIGLMISEVFLARADEVIE
jgi:putative ABC transport system substrate-binding protein